MDHIPVILTTFFAIYVSFLCLPAKILSPFLPTVPLQYVPKIRFTQAIIDCLTTNKTKNDLHKETVILNYNGGDPISYSLRS